MELRARVGHVTAYTRQAGPRGGGDAGRNLPVVGAGVAEVIGDGRVSPSREHSVPRPVLEPMWRRKSRKTFPGAVPPEGAARPRMESGGQSRGAFTLERRDIGKDRASRGIGRLPADRCGRTAPSPRWPTPDPRMFLAAGRYVPANSIRTLPRRPWRLVRGKRGFLSRESIDTAPPVAALQRVGRY